MGVSYYRAHGSPFVPFAEAAASFLGSKPVMEGRGAMVVELVESAIAARDNLCDNLYDNWGRGG